MIVVITQHTVSTVIVFNSMWFCKASTSSVGLYSIAAGIYIDL